MNDIHKHELIKRVAWSSGYSRYAVDGILNATVEVIAAALAADDAVVWTGLVRFEPRARAEHRGVNPRTGEHLMLPARTTLGCTVGVSLKQRVAALRATEDEAEAAD